MTTEAGFRSGRGALARGRPMAVGAGVAAVLVAVVGWYAWASAARDTSLDERRARLASLSQGEKDHLLRSAERLARLDPSEQRRLRELAQAIAADPDSDELRQVMVRYHDWLKALSAVPQRVDLVKQRAELVQLPIDERIARIKTLRAEQAVQTARQTDLRVLFGWFEERLLAEQPEARRAQLAALPTFARRIALFQAAQPGGYRDLLASLSEEDRRQLAARLSPATRQALEEHGPAVLTRLFAERWRDLREGVPWRDFGGHAADSTAEDDAELARFFEHDLAEAQRDRLLSLPPAQMQSQLRIEYVRAKLPELFPGMHRDLSPFPSNMKRRHWGNHRPGGAKSRPKTNPPAPTL